jgi:hypothetical protein
MDVNLFFTQSWAKISVLGQILMSYLPDVSPYECSIFKKNSDFRF